MIRNYRRESAPVVASWVALQGSIMLGLVPRGFAPGYSIAAFQASELA
jgi:hypothetical protein